MLSLGFVEEVQNYRGKIKSEKHIDMLEKIYFNGTPDLKEELTNRKQIGIEKAFTISEFDAVKQLEFLTWLNNGNRKKASDVNMKILKIELEEKSKNDNNRA